MIWDTFLLYLIGMFIASLAMLCHTATYHFIRMGWKGVIILIVSLILWPFALAMMLAGARDRMNAHRNIGDKL